MAGVLSSLSCVNSDIGEHAGMFHNPGGAMGVDEPEFETTLGGCRC